MSFQLLERLANTDASKQPAYGTEKYKEQVETISKVCCEAPDHKTADQMVLLYVLDLEYNRAAISEALKLIDKHFEQCTTGK